MANIDLTTTATVPSGTSITITVYEDTGATVNSTSRAIDDGTNTYTLSGFEANGGSYWIEAEFDHQEVTKTAELDKVMLGGAGGTIDLSGLIEDKQSLIEEIRATTAPLLGPSQSVEVEAQSLLDELDAPGGEPQASREVLKRMIAAEEVTAVAADEPIESIERSADVAFNAAMLAAVEGVAAVGGEGVLGGLLATGTGLLLRNAARFVEDLAPGPRILDEIADDVADTLQDRSDEVGAVVNDAYSAADFCSVSAGGLLAPFEEIERNTKELVIDVTYQQYYLSERIEDIDLQSIEAIDTDREEAVLDVVASIVLGLHPEIQLLVALDDLYVKALDGIDPAIGRQMDYLDDALDADLIAAPENPAERDVIESAGVDVIEGLSAANETLLEAISGIACFLALLEAAVVVAAIAFAVRMRLAGKAILIGLGKLVAEITLLIAAANVVIGSVGGLLGLAYLLAIDKIHVLTVEAIAQGPPVGLPSASLEGV